MLQHLRVSRTILSASLSIFSLISLWLTIITTKSTFYHNCFQSQIDSKESKDDKEEKDQEEQQQEN